MQIQPGDPLVAALVRLCKKLGGPEVVAAATGLSKDNLWQIINGTRLPSGNPRGVGPKLRSALSSAYPDWLDQSDGATETSHTTANIKFSMGDDQAPIVQALESLDRRLKELAPVFQDSGREVMRKWAMGTATVKEVSDALEAMSLASKSMEGK